MASEENFKIRWKTEIGQLVKSKLRRLLDEKNEDNPEWLTLGHEFGMVLSIQERPDLRGIVLSEQEFPDVSLFFPDMSFASIYKCRFNCTFNGVVFDNAEISQSEFCAKYFVQPTFYHAQVRNCIFSNKEIMAPDFEDSIMSDNRFIDCKIINGSATDVDFSRSHFINSRVNIRQKRDHSRKELPLTKEKIVNFSDCIFENTSIYLGYNWEQVLFDRSDMKGITFQESGYSKYPFENASFKSVNAAGVDFSLLHLSGADFTNANLEGVIFRDCDLRNTNFTGANLLNVIVENSPAEGSNLPAILEFTGELENLEARLNAPIRIMFEKQSWEKPDQNDIIRTKAGKVSPVHIKEDEEIYVFNRKGFADQQYKRRKEVAKAVPFREEELVYEQRGETAYLTVKLGAGNEMVLKRENGGIWKMTKTRGKVNLLEGEVVNRLPEKYKLV
jgi:uncharacterized protein YjbI with pentapeptide repeats